jgi:hypothetical protein
MQTLHKLGSPRRTAFWLQAWEIVILLGISAVLAGAVGLGLSVAVAAGGIPGI